MTWGELKTLVDAQLAAAGRGDDAEVARITIGGLCQDVDVRFDCHGGIVVESD